MFIFLSIFCLVNKSTQQILKKKKKKGKWVINDHNDSIYHEIMSKTKAIIAKSPLVVSKYSQFIVTMESW